jgi:hypothetical protein
MERSWGGNLPQEFAFRSIRFITTFVITESGNLSPSSFVRFRRSNMSAILSSSEPPTPAMERVAANLVTLIQDDRSQEDLAPRKT